METRDGFVITLHATDLPRPAALRSATRPFWYLLLFDLAVSLFAVILALTHGQRPDRYFMEGAFTTWVPCGQLLAVAALAGGIYRARRRVAAPGAKVWLLMAGGLLFLAADDAFEIHENFDFWVHRMFHLRETALSDRIDDAVIVLYGLTSLVVLWVYRREMVPFRALRGAMIVGFAFTFGSMIFDTVADRIDVLHFFLRDRALAKIWQHWCGVGDDACKLLAEGCFAAAFYGGWRLARDSDAVLAANHQDQPRRLKASAPR